ncbi:hypothetical protein DL765_005007 [Monosporascus sp. GIB2]|nr:hypothetical protein DL765_005007 [Monosporascus sp. GIB2]
MDIKQTSPGVAAYQTSDEATAGIYEKRNSITGDVYIGDHGADTKLKHLLSTGHVTVIALSSPIGMGLWLGSGLLLRAAVLPTVIVSVNIGAVSVFGEIEVACSSIKFGWVFVAIASMIVLSAGGGNYPAVMPMCIFPMAGSENCGLVAAETANSKKLVSRAVGSIWLRFALFYLLGSLMVTIKPEPLPPGPVRRRGHQRLALRHRIPRWRRAPARPHDERRHRDLGHLGEDHPRLRGIADHHGLRDPRHGAQAVHDGLQERPPVVWPRADFILGGELAYLNVSNSGVEVFCWFSNFIPLFTLFGWGMTCLSHIRMRRVWARQGRTTEERPWKSWLYPYGAWYGMFLCIVLSVVQFYLAVSPLDASPSAGGFFANYVSVILIIVLSLGGRVSYRGNWLRVAYASAPRRLLTGQ